MFDLISDKSRHRQRLVGLCAIVGMILFIAGIQMTCRTPEDTEAIINASEPLRNHDRFCLDLPQPYDFKLRYKMFGGNSFTTAISYYFWTDQPFDRLTMFYRHEFESGGWEMTGLGEDGSYREKQFISFRKENFRVTIERVGGQTANYSMWCAEIRK
jgi:hypothetical protein